MPFWTAKRFMFMTSKQMLAGEFPKAKSLQHVTGTSTILVTPLLREGVPSV